MITEIHTLDDIKEDTCLIFKHSSTCPVSANASKVVTTFSKKHPEVHIYMNIVQNEKELKWALADKYGVKHESPQIIVLRDGKVTASANHYHIENIEQYFS